MDQLAEQIANEIVNGSFGSAFDKLNENEDCHDERLLVLDVCMHLHSQHGYEYDAAVARVFNLIAARI